MLKYLLIGCLFVLISCETSLAQGRLKRKRDSARKGVLAGSRESSDESNDKRNDVEGTIWEFKVMDRKEKDKSKQTKMTGRFRIKESSVFAVGEAVMSGATQANQLKPADDVKGQLRGLLSQRINRAKEQDTGGDHIGDVSKGDSKAYVLRFDEDDNYPLSGRVELKPDTKNKGGVWFGKYVQYLEGNKKQSWRMEMRKVED